MSHKEFCPLCGKMLTENAKEYGISSVLVMKMCPECAELTELYDRKHPGEREFFDTMDITDYVTVNVCRKCKTAHCEIGGQCPQAIHGALEKLRED